MKNPKGKNNRRRPIEIYQIDHTVMDIYIADRNGEHPLNFPIVDRFSGQVIAIPNEPNAPDQKGD